MSEISPLKPGPMQSDVNELFRLLDKQADENAPNPFDADSPPNSGHDPRLLGIRRTAARQPEDERELPQGEREGM